MGCFMQVAEVAAVAAATAAAAAATTRFVAVQENNSVHQFIIQNVRTLFISSSFIFLLRSKFRSKTQFSSHRTSVFLL